ncbi:MAG: ABC transporter permease [Acidobacteria bacterium]|nr:ABC transporter permease [Acidobacteriota bacterium]
MSEIVRVNSPGRRTGAIEAIRETASFSDFVRYQTVRDLKMRYQRSLLGWTWSILNPITSLIIYSVVFGTILGGNRDLPENPDGLENFALYLFSAQVVFSLFQAGSSQTMNSFQQTVELRKRLYFPPASLAIARVSGLLVDTGIEALMLLVFFVLAGSISITFIQLVPLIAVMALFSFGIGLLLAVPNVRFADVGFAYQVILRMLFFLTPIIWVYNETQPPADYWLPLRTIVELNPLTTFVSASRTATYEQLWITPGTWLKLAGMSVILVIAGWVFFHRSADDAAEGA